MSDIAALQPDKQRLTEAVTQFVIDRVAERVFRPGDSLPSESELAKRLNVKRFRDATCGSATTTHFFKPQSGLPVPGTNPPQFDRLTSRTDLVTVGIGGNDAGFASAAISCLNLLPTNVDGFESLALPVSFPLLGSAVPVGGCKQRFVKDGRDLLAERIAASEWKLVNALRERGLGGTRLARATAGTIRNRLLKAGAVVKVSVRRVLVSFSSAWPMQEVFRQAARNLRDSFG